MQTSQTNENKRKHSPSDDENKELNRIYEETLSSFGIRLSTFSNPSVCVICYTMLECYDQIIEDAKAKRKEVGSKSIGSNEDYVFETKGCKHYFHLDCAKQIILNQPSTKYFECPFCKNIQGTKIGNQPESGEMKIRKENFDLPGYTKGWTLKKEGDGKSGFTKTFGRCQGTIVVEYVFRNGVQGKYHPNPGSPYYADNFPRRAYFPATAEGIKIVRLLKVAFDRRLVFTVGRSATTQRDNVIVWNGIHHKTRTADAVHGYPDPQYLQRVEEELKSCGVTEDALKDAANITSHNITNYNITII